MACLIDANVVLRYLLDDHEELSPNFVDALLWAHSAVAHDEVLTFDRSLGKHLARTKHDSPR